MINMANLTMPLFINTIMEFRPTMRPFPNGVANYTDIYQYGSGNNVTINQDSLDGGLNKEITLMLSKADVITMPILHSHGIYNYTEVTQTSNNNATLISQAGTENSAFVNQNGNGNMQ